MATVQMLPNQRSKICAVFGDNCSHICVKCNRAMHFNEVQKRKNKDRVVDDSITCFVRWHDTSFFGLAKEDWELRGIESTREIGAFLPNKLERITQKQWLTSAMTH
ncbi:expressed unknown protein [Seminavis robusta]|uniref:Uncharacterized protein n=1 Tax=Seminavis robusta TaxID=568900 RepID=A0A9N8H3H6_9STRA|nr:expressed unknown protein [Seminavis robusta]|eukprot:Sro39_g024211.1  (106) ;mRNA; f:104472-104789